HWLSGYWVAESLAAAMAVRQSLQPGQCVVVPQGHQVTAQSVSLYAPDNESAGALARQHEIDNLQKAQRAQVLMVDEAQQAAQRAHAAYAEGRQQVEQAQQQLAVAQRRLHDAQVQGIRLQQEADAAAQRSGQLGSDLQEVEQSLETIGRELAQAQTRSEQYDMQLGEQQQRQSTRQQAAELAQQALAQAQQSTAELERARQEAQFEQRSVAQRQEEAQRQHETAQQQAQELQQQRDQAQQEWAELDDSAAQQALQSALAVKVQREQALALKRREYEDLSARMRALDEQRLTVERQIEPQRQRITELQLAEQAARLAMTQAQEHLQAQDTDTIAASVAHDQVTLEQLPEQIERLQRTIQQLGAVNLAALEELAEAQERKTFLDQQSADLNEAIATLEDAIHKIDMETRELLGSTFETVNQHFGRMFPELFGGGQAKLLMTGEEILDAGVQVMAQPPGKKNQTIQNMNILKS
ncbi:MAG: chromosome segregation protein SMC, partial [Burkholderiaceae bacterium]